MTETYEVPADEEQIPEEPESDQPDWQAYKGQGYIRVYRVELGKREQFCSLDRAILEPGFVDNVGLRFGWGEYFFQVCNPRGTPEGTFRHSFGKGGYPRPDEPGYTGLIAPASKSGVPTGMPDATLSAFKDIVKDQNAQNDKNTDRILTMFTTTMQQMGAALTGRPAPNPLEQFAALRDMLPKGDVSQDLLKILLENVLGRVKAESDDEPKGDANMYDVIMKVLPALLQGTPAPAGQPRPVFPAVAQPSFMPPQQPRSPASIAPPGNGRPAPQAREPELTPEQVFVSRVKAHPLYGYFVPRIIEMSRLVSADAAADELLNQLTERHWEEFEKARGERTYEDFLYLFEPEAVAGRGPWFDNVCQQIALELGPEPEPAVESSIVEVTPKADETPVPSE